jgi:Domain of unknown function (DUF4279)
MSTEEKIPWQRAWEEVRCSITVFSDSISVAEISDYIGIEPTRRRNMGEPVSAKRPEILVARHMWIWQVGDSVERSLNAQLNELWGALGSHADKFKDLPSGTNVQLDIWIAHRGSELSLGWVLDWRHVLAAAAFGASINVDEYDDTSDEECR